MGPYASPPFPKYRVSPMGIAVGKYQGKKRLIVDLSTPHDNQIYQSLNELVDKDEFSLSYVKLDTAIKIIQEKGLGSWLCKDDIKDAFKLLPIKENLWPYYGIKWDKKYYFTLG